MAIDHDPRTATHRAIWNQDGKTAGYGTLQELEERRRNAATMYSPEDAYAHGGAADFRIVRIDIVKVKA